MNKWIAEFELEDGDIMPEHMDLNYKGVKIDFHCKPLEQGSTIKNDLGVDCISREQALVAIRNLYPSMPRVDFNGSLRKWADKYKPYIECEDAIEELAPVTPQEPRWIPVSERLPENKETVLVTFKHFVSGNTIGLGSVILLRGKPHWHVREQNLGTYDVLAWMPLQKAYREVEE